MSSSKIPEQLIQKFERRTGRVGVIGLGYVGLPLAVEFAKAGLRTVGIDINTDRVRQLNAGRSYITDIPSSELAGLVKSGKLSATTRYNVLKDLDGVMICVPTPLRKSRDPDISYIVSATEALAKHLHRHQIISLESTTYPGTTREVILPMLEATGLKVGGDFFLGFSPERIDPGNKVYTTKTIPKVVSGITPACGKALDLMYGQIIQKIIPVSSTDVAEMVKLLENPFRAVNIGLVNELALMCHRLGVDVWEVIEAAKSKPFGFMAFYPGPGLGGHCIPIDPLYLSWKARILGFESRFIELAAQLNATMPEHVVERVAELLNRRGKAIRGSKILLLGVAYKRDVSDVRESPALEIIQHLARRGARIQYHDPYVPSLRTDGLTLRSVPLRPSVLRSADCVVIVTDHHALDQNVVVKYSRLILDTRNALKNLPRRSNKIVRL